MTAAEVQLAIQQAIATKGISLSTTSYVVLGIIWFLGVVLSSAIAMVVQAVRDRYVSSVAERAAIARKRWETKFECFSKIADALGGIHATSQLRNEQHLAAVRPHLAQINEYGSVGRIAVRPEIRTLFSTIGDHLNGAKSTDERRKIAHHYWMAVMDVARQDLFGEKREMTDAELLRPPTARETQGDG